MSDTNDAGVIARIVQQLRDELEVARAVGLTPSKAQYGKWLQLCDALASSGAPQRTAEQKQIIIAKNKKLVEKMEEDGESIVFTNAIRELLSLLE